MVKTYELQYKKFLVRIGLCLVVILVGCEQMTKEELLIYTAHIGYIEKTKELLNQGVDVNTVSNIGMTPLMMAVLRRKLEMVKFLITHEANIDAKRPEFGQTALMWAANGGQEQMVQFLVEQGADINMQDEKGWTALMWAARRGSSAVINVLLAANANPHLTNHNGETALSLATQTGHQKSLQLLQN